MVSRLIHIIYSSSSLGGSEVFANGDGNAGLLDQVGSPLQEQCYVKVIDHDIRSVPLFAGSKPTSLRLAETARESVPCL